MRKAYTRPQVVTVHTVPAPQSAVQQLRWLDIALDDARTMLVVLKRAPGWRVPRGAVAGELGTVIVPEGADCTCGASAPNVPHAPHCQGEKG